MNIVENDVDTLHEEIEYLVENDVDTLHEERIHLVGFSFIRVIDMHVQKKNHANLRQMHLVEIHHRAPRVFGILLKL